MGELVGELDHGFHAGDLDRFVRPLGAGNRADRARELGRVPDRTVRGLLRRLVGRRARGLQIRPDARGAVKDTLAVLQVQEP